MKICLNKPALGALALLVTLTACKSKKPEPTTLTSAAAAQSAQPEAANPLPAFAVNAKMMLPPIRSLFPKQTFGFGGDVMTVELCRMDASAPPMIHRHSDKAAPRLAAGPDGVVWMLDHEQKLRRYVNRSKTGCELALDPSFGNGGAMDLGDVSSSSTLVVDGANNLFLTSYSDTKKLAGGMFVDHCKGRLLAQPTSKLTLLDDGILTSDAPACTRTPLSFKGFRGEQPRPIGLFGDEILVSAEEKEAKIDVRKLGVQRADGTQRLVFGKSKGEEWLRGLKMATRCGDDICAFTNGLGDAKIVRYTKAGTFVGRRTIKDSRISNITFAAATAEETFIQGSEVTSSGKDDYTGVVLLMRSKPAPSLLQPPSREPIAGPARGTLRGQPFVATKITFEYSSGRWKVRASNMNGSAVRTELLVPPRAGAISRSGAAEPRASGGAYLDPNDVLDPELKKKRMSSDVVASVREHRIEITRWDVRPYDKKEGGFQDLGYASGKLVIDFPHESSEGPNEDSLVVGEFTDALVQAWDDPDAPKK